MSITTLPAPAPAHTFGTATRDIWGNGDFRSPGQFLVRKGDLMRVYSDAPIIGYPFTFEPVNGGRAFCGTRADWEEVEH